MKAVQVIAEILQREGIEFLACYARNPLIEACAEIGIRTLHCRQERVGIGIADGFARASQGQGIGVVAVQGGPGIENAFPGIAQAYAENVPLLIVPGGERTARQYNRPSFRAVDAYRPVTKWAAPVSDVQSIPDHMRRAFHLMRSGRPGPVLLEVALEVWEAEFSGEIDYTPPAYLRSAPEAGDVKAMAQAFLAAERPIIWAGAGVLRAQATPELVQFADLVQAPVMATNPGKSAFPDSHPLSLGAATGSAPKALKHFLGAADCVLAIGSSLTRTPFGPAIPPGKTILHATNAADDINKDYAVAHACLGDAKLVLGALIAEVKELTGGKGRDGGTIEAEISTLKEEWRAEFAAQFSSDEVPINPYRIIGDLMGAVDVDQTIITHDAGGPREHLLPFWQSDAPGSYMGWGKTTQLGCGLGLTMGAKLARPEKLCINVMGDAAIGMVGMDLETAVRNSIGILSLVFNNGVMAMERSVMPTSIERFSGHTLGGNYQAVAAALGVMAQRVETPDQFLPALEAAIGATRTGQPALIECLTTESTNFSRYP